MISLLKCEFMKTRRRYIFLTAHGITAVWMCWALYGHYTSEVIKNGWMMFLYQFPLINAIFIPILSIVVSSRICDIEHKSMMFKYILTIKEKGKIYDAKFVYGLGIVLSCVMLSWIVTIVFGKIIGFYGSVPMRLYLLYLLFTIIPAIAVHVFQHMLAILFKNQAVAFFSGIIGEFGGIFSMFLPQIPLLRKMLIWGYFGVLQFVGMFGWSKEEQMSNVYFAVIDIDWIFFEVLITVSIVMYIIGRKLFCEREV